MARVRTCALALALSAGSAGTLVAPPALAGGAKTPPAGEQSAAKDKYRAGAAAYASGRYKDAIDLFLDANRISPSAALSFDVARAYEQLGDQSKALDWYRDYVRRAKGAPDGEQVQEKIDELDRALVQKELQQVTVLSDPSSATVTIDGQPVGVTPWTSDLVFGFHHATVTRKGYADAERDFVLSRDGARDVFVSMNQSTDEAMANAAGKPAAPLPPKKPAAPVATSSRESGSSDSATSSPVEPGQPGETTPTTRPQPVAARPKTKSKTSPLVTWGWVTLGAGGAALGGALAFELLRNGSENDAKHESTQIGYKNEIDTARSQQTAARVLFGVGSALTVTGGTLLIVGFGKSKKEPQFDVAVSGSPSRGSVWVNGRF